MNLQENILRIREMIGVINEETTSSEKLQDILNSIIPNKFSGIKKVTVSEENLDQHTYYIHVWVIFEKNETVYQIDYDFEDVKKTIRDLAYYLSLHVNQISFATENN